MFSQTEIETLRYYVYCLVDPRDNKIFYIGKGSGNRVFQHVQDTIICEDTSSLKLDIIRSIHNQGSKIRYYIIRHNLNESEAFLVESVLIDMLSYNHFNLENFLSNIQAGHHQWDEGIKTIEEINALYNNTPLSILKDDKLLFVNLNKTYLQNSNEDVYSRPSIYESTRKYWKVNFDRVQRVDYVCGVYRGVIRAVYKPIRWYVVEDASLFHGRRCAFDGVEIVDSIYLNKDVKNYVGGQNPIKYINL